MSADPLPARGGTAANGKTSDTSAQAAAQLTRTGTHWNSFGGTTTVTYAFRTSGTPPVDGGATFYQFTAAQITAAELALKGWSDAANISFVRVGSGTSGTDAYSNSASILFGGYVPTTDDGAAAFAYNPGSTSATSRAGDVWVNQGDADNKAPAVGDYGQQVLAHEIGHALGLSHPGDYNASATNDPTYASDAAYYEDARQYTIMSYFGSTNTGGMLGAFAAAPQMDDIAAIQRLYGANYATRSGDTVYGFHSNADRAWFIANDTSTPLVFAVWDGGGNDTLDFSGYSQNQRIDLRQGAFSDVGGYVHNVGIAVGAVIENAIGGSGADAIVGNDSANVLTGNAGADTLYGGLGSDTLTGGAGNDDFDGSRAELAGDHITDLTTGDHVHISAVDYGSFAFQHLGGSLALGQGSSLTLDNYANGRIIVAQSGDGVDLTVTTRYSGLNDFNGDGHSDILWRNADGAISLWSLSGNASGNIVQQNTYYNSGVGNDWQIRETMDFNGDGASDILWRQSGGAISIWNSSGNAFTVNYYDSSVGTDWTIAAAGDLNGDGKDDLLWRNANGTISVWQSNGTGFVQNTYSNSAVGNEWQIAGEGDFNGDGKDDILWRNAAAGQISEWWSTGQSFAVNSYIGGGMESSWKIDAVADFNGDGKDDVLWRNDNGTLAEWQSTGAGFTTVFTNNGVGNDWTLVQAADFNDDGKADLLWRNANGDVATWQSTGNSFASLVYQNAIPTSWQIEAHDWH